jgi:NADH-quinone oxidoreductase subunit J
MSFEGFDQALFGVLAVVALASALFMILQRNPTYSAFSFIVTLCSISGIYGLLGSSFIAVLQIVVYAGAIMVLFLFVLMLLNVRSEDHVSDHGPLRVAATVLAIVFLAQTLWVFASSDFRHAAAVFAAPPEKVARVLFSERFLYAFEATSVLILAALVGAIFLAEKTPKGSE